MAKSRFVRIARRNEIEEKEFYAMVTSMYEELWQGLLPPQIPTQELSASVAKSVITPPDTPVPDCRSCGACCTSMLCVGVRPGEQFDRADCWDVVAESSGRKISVDRFLKRDGESFSCVALEGTFGEDVSCRVYEQRPKTCRMFEAGSDKCHALRRAYGLEPFLTVSEMSEALEKLESRPRIAEHSEVIENVRISAEEDSADLKITALMKDRTLKTIYTFDPSKETWRQFEFDGLTLSQAKDLINSRCGAPPAV